MLYIYIYIYMFMSIVCVVQHYDHESAGQPIATRVTRHPDPVLPVPVKKPSIKDRLDQPYVIDFNWC